MIKIGKIFQFEAPKGWTEIRQESRCVFHGSNRQELIASASVIQGFGTENDLTAAQQRLFQNAERSVRNAAAHPTLNVTQPFQREFRASNVECWSLMAQTHKGEVLFHQAIFSDARGVLLVTLEAPNTAQSLRIFEQFIKSVEVISESDALVE